MKKCIYCGQENEESAAACSGCGKPFERPPGTKGAPDLVDPALDPVIVATFENTEHASVLQTRLQAAGIEAWVPEDCSVEFPPQGASVQVATKDALAAGLIVTEFMKSTEPAPPEAKSVPPTSSDEENARGAIPGRRMCVSCGAAIPYEAVLCPKCGWTQPQVV